jgi:magnesium-transporting ATPase (P-type)
MYILAFKDYIILLDTTNVQWFINNILIAVTIVLVSIPEGLPMALGLGLAFTLNDNKLWVTNVSALERIGGA